MSAPIPTFVDPRGGGARWPKWFEISGRLVGLVTTNFKIGVEKFKGKPGEIADEADFDLYVLDGSWPLLYGALDDGTRPPTHRVAGPAMFAGCSTQNSNIVKTLRRIWGGRPSGQMILGFIEKSEIGGKPWNVEAIPPGDPRRALAAQIFGEIAAETRQWATPVELAPAQTPTSHPGAFLPIAVTPPAMPAFLQAAAPAAPALVKPAQMTDEQWASLTGDQKQQAITYFASLSQNPF